MKILIVPTGILPIPAFNGGAVETLVEMLINYNEEKEFIDIDIINLHDNKYDLVYDMYKKCNFLYVKFNFINKLFRGFRYIINKYLNIYIGNEFISRVVSKVKSNNYDVIIIENSPEYVLKLKSKFPNSKFVLHLHNDFLNRTSKLNKKIFNYYDEIYCISNYIKTRVEEIDKNNKIKVLYNGIDLKRFNSSNIKNNYEIRSKYGIKKRKINFTFSGRIVSEKGIIELLLAFKKIEKYIDANLIIIGNIDNIKEKHVKDLINETRKLTDKIIFTNFIDYKVIDQIYNITDVGIIPSICNEAFNLTTIEFMAMKKPLIISNRGAIKEIATSKSALIVAVNNNYVNNLASAMIRMYEDIELREKLSFEAYNRSRYFSKDKYCESFFYLIKQIGG